MPPTEAFVYPPPPAVNARCARCGIPLGEVAPYVPTSSDVCLACLDGILADAGSGESIPAVMPSRSMDGD